MKIEKINGHVFIDNQELEIAALLNGKFKLALKEYANYFNSNLDTLEIKGFEYLVYYKDTESIIFKHTLVSNSYSNINKLFSKEYEDDLLKTLKLEKGDKIKIINYGSLICCEKELYLKHPEYPIYREYFVNSILNEIELYIDYDWKPELVGKEFIVEKQLGLYVWTECGEVFKNNQIEKL